MADPSSDFFGVGMLGADPYHQMRMNRLNRLSAIDSMTQPYGVASSSPSEGVKPSASVDYAAPTMSRSSGDTGLDAYYAQPVSQQTATTTGGWNPNGGAFANFLSGLARNTMTTGSGGFYQPRMAAQTFGLREDPGSDPNNPPDTTDPGTGRGGDPNPPGGGGPPGGNGPNNPPPGGTGCPPGQIPCPRRDGTMYCSASGGCGSETPPPPGGNPPPGSSGCPPGYVNQNGSCVLPGAGSSGPPPAGGNGTGLYTDATIPGDIKQLRNNLGWWLSNNFGQYNPAFPGSLQVGMSPFANQAETGGQQGVAQGMGFLNSGAGALAGFLNGSANGALSGLQDPLSRILGGSVAGYDPSAAMGALNSSPNYFNANVGWATNARDVASPYLNESASILQNLGIPNIQDLAQSGGAPDITNALAAQRTQSLSDLDQQLAQIKEQYAGQGLGAGSDIATAMAKGAAQGIGQMNTNQTQLIAQVMNDAANRRLAATGQLPGLAGGIQGLGSTLAGLTQGIGQANLAGGQGMQNLGSLYNNIASTAGGFNNDALNRMLQGLSPGLSIANQGNQNTMQALSMLPGFANSTGSLYGNYGQLMSGLAGIDTQRMGNNMNMTYQDWVRQTTAPYLNPAIAMATGFPPQQPIIPSQGGWGSLGGILGGIGGILGGIL